MASVTLSASPRTGVGTGDARKLRQSGNVPAIIYGHGRSPQSLALNARELERLLSHISAGSTVVELTMDGGGMSRTLIREVQRHPFKKMILHVDFQELVAGEKVTVDVPLVFVGTPAGAREGGILDQIMHQLTILVDPSVMPNHLDVDVSGLTIGHSLHVSDIQVPAGVEVLDEEDATVCTLGAPKASETPVAGVEVVEAAAEPELIRKTKDEEGEEEK